MRTIYKDETTHYQPIYGFAFFCNQVARRYSHRICVHDLFLNYRTVSCTILTQGITKANVKQCMSLCMSVCTMYVIKMCNKIYGTTNVIAKQNNMCKHSYIVRRGKLYPQ